MISKKDQPLPPPPPPPRESSSNRSFGLTLGGVLIALGGIRVGIAFLGGISPFVDLPTACLGVVGGALIALALLRPAWLTVPNRLWHQLGLLLARVVNPAILLLLYATCVVPIGLIMRAFGHDPLRLKRASTTQTYWLAHEPSPLEHPMRYLF